MLLAWNDGEEYSLPFLELRFFCPCAGCVDEHTGQRTIQKNSIKPDIRPVKVDLVGRYAVHLAWSDGHQTGIYHYETLRQLCQKVGQKIDQPSPRPAP